MQSSKSRLETLARAGPRQMNISAPEILKQKRLDSAKKQNQTFLKSINAQHRHQLIQDQCEPQVQVQPVRRIA